MGNMGVKQWLSKKREWCDTIDFVYLRTKMGIWFFSATISIIPIVSMGARELIEGSNVISAIYDYVLGSADTVYALVTMLTIVLADVLCSMCIDGKESKGSILFYCLTHIVLIMSGTILYVLCKIENVDYYTMKNLNKGSFTVVIILSFLSYVNVSTFTQRGSSDI